MSIESKHEDIARRPTEDIPVNALRILEAAMSLFARKGYAATSVREVVQEAEVTNPMLYYYFDSKEGLFTALTELMHLEFARDLEQAMQTDLPFEEKLVGVVDVHLRGVRETPDVLRFVYSLLFGSDQSCPPNRLYESHEEIISKLTRLLETSAQTGDFHPSDEFDITWSALQLLSLINSHSMRLIKELERIEEPRREAWLSQQAGREAARRLVRFFLYGASHIEK